mgnify:CR=1 FL=1
MKITEGFPLIGLMIYKENILEIENVGIWKMLDYRACPKCRGDMHTRRDTFGDFKECIQCGLMQDLELEQKSDTLAVSNGRKNEAGQAA